jgi:hypothetical protein
MCSHRLQYPCAMNYRHAFHAGNFADVLMILIEHLKK